MSYDQKPDLSLSRRARLLIMAFAILLLVSLPVLVGFVKCAMGNCL